MHTKCVPFSKLYKWYVVLLTYDCRCMCKPRSPTVHITVAKVARGEAKFEKKTFVGQSLTSVALSIWGLSAIDQPLSASLPRHFVYTMIIQAMVVLCFSCVPCTKHLTCIVGQCPSGALTKYTSTHGCIANSAIVVGWSIVPLLSYQPRCCTAKLENRPFS